MESQEISICPPCQGAGQTGAYFCQNCGAPLKEKPRSTSLGAQIKVYAVCVLLPPFGLIYVLRYLKQPDEKSRRIGWIALILTIVMTIATLWLAVVAMDSFNQLVNSMLGGGQF
ncbi:MAG: hypothetical protein ABSD31_06435 [Candidatus Binataceae bacterium]|jgi:hypothetical protein